MNPILNDDVPRKVRAGQGFAWVTAGFAQYRKNPLLLSAAFGALFGTVMLLGIIPYLGGALSELATPLMIAGFMAAYRALDDGRKLDWDAFFAGIKRVPLPLMTLGAVQLLATLLIGQIMMAMGFDAKAMLAVARSDQPSPAEMQAIMNQSMPALLVGVALFVPLMMATWFAPALVLFGNARPATALVVSLKAGLRNWAALLANGLALGVLLLVAALIPMMLGLLFAMPILFGSMYASYQNVFAVWGDAPARADAVSPDD